MLPTTTNTDDDDKWDRRDKERKARHELADKVSKLEGEIDAGLERLAEEVEELKEYLRGGPNNQDPLGTRVHLAETGITELRILVKGDALGRGSLIELAKLAAQDAAEAKRIAEGRVAFNTARRGHYVTLTVAIVSTIGMITVGVLANWDKIQSLQSKPETPIEWAERIKREIEEVKKDRGPEVQARLKEIEKAARVRR